jgi:transcriptional regulator of acetoin/glycerol metabolism
VILSRGGTIAAEHIPAEVRGESGPLNPAKTMTREEEEKRILEVLEQTDWNKAKSARLLGISRKTLYQKIRKYNLSPESR